MTVVCVGVVLALLLTVAVLGSAARPTHSKHRERVQVRRRLRDDRENPAA